MDFAEVPTEAWLTATAEMYSSLMHEQCIIGLERLAIIGMHQSQSSQPKVIEVAKSRLMVALAIN